MDHLEAVKHKAVEKYLLGELAAPERDEFEAHFFECPECAKDLVTTAAFLDATRKELGRGSLKKPVSKVVHEPWFSFLWRPTLVLPALSVLAMVVAYQYIVLYPRWSNERVNASQPEVLAPLSLIGANSRDGSVRNILLTQAQPLLLSLDIPTADTFSRYDCVLLAPSGTPLWRVPISSEQARDTVSIRVPARHWDRGEYTLRVQGYTSPGPGQTLDLARYRFSVNESKIPLPP